MTTKSFRIGAFAAGIMSAGWAFPAKAALPSLEDKDWLGYYVGAEIKNFQLGVTTDGKITIKILNEKNEPLNNDLTIGIEIEVEETMPDGKKISRKIDPDSLESAQEATQKPKNVMIKGKVTGDIGFEVSLDEDRGKILLGGRVSDPAAGKNPLRFSIGVRIPNTSPKESGPKEGEKVSASDAKKKAKEQEEKTKGDKVHLIWTDGKKTKLQASEPVEGASKEVTGPGITAVAVESSAFKGNKIMLAATPNSSMTLANGSKQPLAKGFTLHWSADPAKDLKGEARLSIEVK